MFVYIGVDLVCNKSMGKNKHKMIIFHRLFFPIDLLQTKSTPM